MNEIIKNIEAEQLKKDVPQFNVGDNVRVHALIKELSLIHISSESAADGSG